MNRKINKEDLAWFTVIIITFLIMFIFSGCAAKPKVMKDCLQTEAEELFVCSEV